MAPTARPSTHCAAWTSASSRASSWPWSAPPARASRRLWPSWAAWTCPRRAPTPWTGTQSRASAGVSWPASAMRRSASCSRATTCCPRRASSGTWSCPCSTPAWDGKSAASGPWPCSRRWASPTRRTSCPRRSPGVRSSGSPWPGPWPTPLPCCWRMSPRAPWTRRQAPRCWSSSRSCTARATPCCWSPTTPTSPPWQSAGWRSGMAWSRRVASGRPRWPPKSRAPA